MKVVKGDTVLVIQGKDRGKRGEVISATPNRDRVLVEGMNKVKRHMRKTSAETPGGIVEMEAPMHVSNVMVVCPKCDKATRVSKRVIESGQRVRICKKCGEIIDRGK